jgi:signal transduction histidine kinase
MIQNKLLPKLIVISVLGLVAFMLIGFFSSIFLNKLLEDKSDGFIAPKKKIELIKLSLANMSIDQREIFVDKLNLHQREKFTLLKSENEIDCDRAVCQKVKIDTIHTLFIGEEREKLTDMIYGKRPHPRERPKGNLNNKRRPLNSNLLMTIGVQLVAMIFYIIILLVVIFYYAKKRREVGEEVFEKIRQGSLDARFPISRVDDFGTNTKLFNEMADEIMNLVLELRKKDENRKLLFKTLAHDLKTPAASLKGIMETLTLRKDELTEDQKCELYKMSNMEIDYFTSLLDDILFLAKVQDPEFKNTSGKSELVSSLRDVCDSISFLNKDIKLEFNTDIEEFEINLERNSLMRLLRNALDNAFSYGQSSVSVDIKLDDKLKIIIKNDGDGFDDNAIKNFGVMKNSRTRTNSQGSLSFGMGSVIMAAIVESINGKLTPENVYSSSHQIIGSSLIIEVPA